MERNGWTNLDFLFAQRDFPDNLQTRGLVRFRVDQVLGFKNVFVLLAVGMEVSALGCGGGGVMGAAEVLPCVHLSTIHRVSEMLNTRDWDGMTWDENKTYDVRLRFWRARGLLSTSGGILFATVSGECTRNAKSVVAVGGLARLPMNDATGSGDEGDISNNDRDGGRDKSEPECFQEETGIGS